MSMHLEMAKAEYREFIHRLSPYQARHVPLYYTAPSPSVDIIDVSREAMLDRFLTENAEFEPYREHLSGTLPELREFPVAKNVWEGINA